jgi:hypothetical protein
MFKRANATYDATGEIISSSVSNVEIVDPNAIGYDHEKIFKQNLVLTQISNNNLDVVKSDYLKNLEKLKYYANQEQLYQDYLNNQQNNYLKEIDNIKTKCYKKMEEQTNEFNTKLNIHKMECSRRIAQLEDERDQMRATYPNVFSSTLLEN